MKDACHSQAHNDPLCICTYEVSVFTQNIAGWRLWHSRKPVSFCINAEADHNTKPIFNPLGSRQIKPEQQ